MGLDYKKLIYQLNFEMLIYLCIMSMLFGGGVVYGVYFDNTHESIFKWGYLKMVNNLYDTNLIATIIGTVTTLFGISIPILFSTVADHLKEFNDTQVSKYFTKEFEFRFQLYTVPILIGFCMLLIFIDCKMGFISFCLLLFFIYFLFRIYYFIRLVIRYSTETDEIIFEKTHQDINGIIGG